MTTQLQQAAAAFFLLLPLCAPGQTGPYNSRAEEIEAQRKEKAGKLTPETTSGTERALVEIRERRVLEKITYGIGGLRAKIGGLVTNSGFAVGPEYFRDDLANGNIRFRATTQFSTRLYQLYETEFSLPRLANDHLFVTLLANHRNFPQMQYYGPGPDSLKTGRSNYRLEDTRFNVRAGVSPFRGRTRASSRWNVSIRPLRP
jgi:hypothetical protein